MRTSYHSFTFCCLYLQVELLEAKLVWNSAPAADPKCSVHKNRLNQTIASILDTVCIIKPVSDPLEGYFQVTLSPCSEMFHNFYIFNRKGKCLFYKEWDRPVNKMADDPEEEKKLVLVQTTAN